MAPVSAIFPNQDEGAPGPSLLGTGDIDTMQELTSTRTPDAFTTLPPVCLFSEASGHRSIFTGKERDPETGEANGNDYFGARYYASSMGRFMSPDWSATVEPVPYSKLDDPQSLNLYAYMLNNPLGGVDPDGHCGVGPSDPCTASQQACIDMGKCDPGSLKAQQTDTQAQQQNGDPTLPTAVQEPISPLDKALGPTPSNMLMVVTGDLGELAELGKALTGAAEASEALSKAGTIEKLTADAKELYPRLAEKADQLHHVIPKYLGGAQDGALAKIPAAYHQVITNAFRTLAPYGQAISRTSQEVTNIVKQVYSMFPLP